MISKSNLSNIITKSAQLLQFQNVQIGEMTWEITAAPHSALRSDGAKLTPFLLLVHEIFLRSD